MRIKVLVVLAMMLSISCKEKTVETVTKTVKAKPVKFLPFQQVGLEDLSDFNRVTENWKITGGAYVDRSKDKMLMATEGTGVLVNNPEDGKNGHLFTFFEHGNIELEIDVMMPKGSNSGIYLQGRYEVQLFDSWGVENPKHSDMGGIYQRWDESRGTGKEGFEGVAPRVNAAKAPGLWQHYKIIFHAPKFDSDGTKIQNAFFEEVWLNGVLVQESVELSGPTRAAAFQDEKPSGPLMIQGDHGPVAIKNIRYKMYDDNRVTVSEMTMTEYESNEMMLPNFDSLVPMRRISTDSISANMATGERTRRILRYDGKLNIPASGDYLFDLKLNEAGGILMVNKDTVVNLNGDYNLDSLGLGKITLQNGSIPFTLVYNKHRPWRKGFSLEVEGPGIQKHSLNAPGSLDLSDGRPASNIMVEVDDEPETQRSFLMHEGKKRTHCISVGTPQKIHYAYDLDFGSLLKVWNGDFLDATQMWHSRGEKQLGLPAGFLVSFHGDPEFAQLENEKSVWPITVSERSEYRHQGYEFDDMGYPVFFSELGDSRISDKMMPSKTLRMLHRSIEIKGIQHLWHKVAEGESIEKLADGTYIVNDESYFIDFTENENLNPLVRVSNGKNELLLKVPEGNQLVEYSIIW